MFARSSGAPMLKALLDFRAQQPYTPGPCKPAMDITSWHNGKAWPVRKQGGFPMFSLPDHLIWRAASNTAQMCVYPHVKP